MNGLKFQDILCSMLIFAYFSRRASVNLMKHLVITYNNHLLVQYRQQKISTQNSRSDSDYTLHCVNTATSEMY